MAKIKLFSLLLIIAISRNVVCADYDINNLQTLFTDKKQRTQIDAARSGVDITSSRPKTQQVKVSGYVTRSDGESVVWVNGGNTLTSSRVNNIKVYKSRVGENKTVTVSVDGKTRRLKPGETWRKGSTVSVNHQ